MQTSLKMENATIWVVQPRTHKVGKTVPSIPHFCEGKICDERIIRRLCMCHLWIVLQSDVFHFCSWCFEANVLAATYPRLYKYEYHVFSYIYTSCEYTIECVVYGCTVCRAPYTNSANLWNVFCNLSVRKILLAIRESWRTQTIHRTADQQVWRDDKRCKEKLTLGCCGNLWRPLEAM